MNQTYNGPVRVYSTKANGDQLVIGKGDRKGERYYKLSFKVGGEYVNLFDFDGVTGGQDGEYSVEFYQKFHPNGEPDLYNDKPQYQLVSIAPLGAPQQAKSAPAVSGQTHESNDQRQKSIEMQTIIKAWGEVKAGSAVDPIGFASDVKAVWKEVFGEPEKNELDQMLSAAKDKLDATVEDEDGDSDIPFLS
jgi:hypothetical protein